MHITEQTYSKHSQLRFQVFANKLTEQVVFVKEKQFSNCIITHLFLKLKYIQGVNLYLYRVQHSKICLSLLGFDAFCMSNFGLA